MKQLISNIIDALVDDIDSVTVNEILGRQTNIYEIKVSKNDLGKVIGKKGKTANALRTLINASASKNNKRVIIEIIE